MTSKLMQAFDFTEKDLSHNRQGQLSPRQLENLTRQTRSSKGRLLSIGLICLGIAVYLALPFIQSMSLQGDILRLIGVVGLSGLSIMFFSSLFDRPDLKVSSAEGRVQFISRESTTDEDGTLITHTHFYIVIGKNEYAVDSSQYDAFSQGHVYRVYSGSTDLLSSGILSIDYLGPPA